MLFSLQSASCMRRERLAFGVREALIVLVLVVVLVLESTRRSVVSHFRLRL
jgi:hypothetical protein